MTGAELDARVVCLLEQHPRVKGFHWPDSLQVTEKGWPDWMLLGPGGLIFRETKGAGQVPSGEQRAVGYALQALGYDWALWAPWDYHCGAIERQIEALSTRRGH
jgi:hypothetical protein